MCKQKGKEPAWQDMPAGGAKRRGERRSAKVWGPPRLLGQALGVRRRHRAKLKNKHQRRERATHHGQKVQNKQNKNKALTLLSRLRLEATEALLPTSRAGVASGSRLASKMSGRSKSKSAIALRGERGRKEGRMGEKEREEKNREEKTKEII